MKHDFGVTIGTTLDGTDIRSNKTFQHTCVLDMRRCVNNGPFPIEETTLRKLANFRVAYEQMPASMYSGNSRMENDLFRMITEQRGNVLILTDEPVPLARFCRQMDIPFSSRDRYFIETADDYVPVQQPNRASNPARFGSLAS